MLFRSFVSISSRRRRNHPLPRHGGDLLSHGRPPLSSISRRRLYDGSLATAAPWMRRRTLAAAACRRLCSSLLLEQPPRRTTTRPLPLLLYAKPDGHAILPSPPPPPPRPRAPSPPSDGGRFTTDLSGATVAPANPWRRRLPCLCCSPRAPSSSYDDASAPPPPRLGLC